MDDDEECYRCVKEITPSGHVHETLYYGYYGLPKECMLSVHGWRQGVLPLCEGDHAEWSRARDLVLWLLWVTKGMHAFSSWMTTRSVTAVWRRSRRVVTCTRPCIMVTMCYQDSACFQFMDDDEECYRCVKEITPSGHVYETLYYGYYVLLK